LFDSLSKVMAQVSACVDPEEELASRKFPGYFLMLTCPATSLQSWATRVLKKVGAISAGEFRQSVEPIFASWVKLLEEECLGASGGATQDQG
jgi:hypothetical protein